ncbi:AP-4 complex accessory subunit RUSC2 isoform X3 [Balaenoptera acutorostrata]|uniref:AP-4 complex accessory subunit RUSC2 isoform X3 n=1 Tax=Balaenoptera acutorostrata TaxID=9767 RepID=A0ABM3TPA3_BALAC|nr:AP-4 complex accessory subunit RUSC2 isoform X3 [Balaenoptera acutorostrata]
MPLFELSRMDSPPKLTGETLIVHHIPLVHCQVPDRQCCGGASAGGGSTRPNPFCPPELGITQPDQDLGQADSLLYNSLHSAPGGSARSADSTKNRGRDGRGPGAPKRHNPFLLQEGVAEPRPGDLYDDSIGDGATQQSFHLHRAGQPTFHLSSFQLPPPGPRVGRPWGATRSRAGVVEGQEQEPVTTLDAQQCSTSHSCRPEPEAETMELDEYGGPGGSGSGGGASDTSGFSFDQEWKLSSDESPRNPRCSGSGPQHCRCSSTSSPSEAADQSMGYVSDSSCNSSDGVLVTFSTLYNKMHGNSHANLNSAPQSCSDSSFCSHSDPSAFYLDLQPSPAESKMSWGGAESRPVLRYSKEQRPTTLPIQPFVFQHHFPKQLAKSRALHSLSQLYSLSGCTRAPQRAPLAAPAAQVPAQAPSGEFQAPTNGGARRAGPEPQTSRPSPLGSYSPIRSAGPFGPSTDSSASTSCSPPPEQTTATESPPPWARSCPPAVRPATSQQPQKEHQKILTLAEYRLHGTGSLPPLGSWRSSLSRAESLARGGGEGSMASRPNNANHLSPQALKWREYRRKNPLGPPGLSGSLDRRPQDGRLARRNPIFEFPGSLGAAGHLNCRLNGQVVKPLPLTCPDFQDPFSLTEKPPAEFCLSPDGNSEAVSIDLLQKKGLVKAINTAVDLIVAHFGTSRDPGVKAKLGNSSVSPNVGHLVLKYLCPAVRAVLEDGLKAFVLDVIIGQRKNTPWSVVEASTQLGPSTKVLHGLYNKVSQFPELTSHTMRFNAFILGLLNIRSLEFWFNHLYNHEDIIQTHYQPWGFLSAAHTVCPGLLEELLLLLQPLALLPFSLDLLFQHRLLQSGQRQRQHKELLRVSQDLLLSAHSTLQLARSRGQEGPGDMDGAARGERVKGVGAPEGGEDEEEEKETEAAGSSGRGRWARSGQAGWWYQLMQSSQVYIDGSTEGSRFPRGGSNSSSGSSSEKKKGTGGGGPPPREGVVEGAEACPAPEETLGRERGWPFWMGSPPDSVLAELRRSREREGSTAPPAENEEGALEPSPGVIKWGHLFGSRKAQREARPTNRLPSDWLSLDKSMLQLVAQTVGARREPEPKESLQEPRSPAPPSSTPCEVKALCHHLATGPGQLSFHKGDVLRVLGPAGGDWLRCSRGPDTGLVPLAYVTLTPTPSPTPGSSQN